MIALVKRLLEQAEQGQLRAVAIAGEDSASYPHHEAAFGKLTNRTMMVGSLHVLANHIVLNECLEWKPE